jgi:copper(I)-binding protein
MNLRVAWMGAAAMVAAAATAMAQPPPTVTARDAWARATPPGAINGVIYMVLSSPQGDVLTGISTPAAAKAVVHDEQVDGGVIRMRALPGGLPLPAGQSVFLRPGSFHIMLEGLKSGLRQGQTVTVHLTFAKAAPMDVTARVLAVGASGQAMPGMSMAP